MQHLLSRIKALAKRRWFTSVLVAVGLSLALLVIGGIVYRDWPQFQTFSWQLNLLPLVGAAAALVAAFGLNIVAWILISHTFGSQVGFWKDLEIYSFSTVVRRLPGAIWQLAGRTYLYRQEKTTLAVPLWGTLWELVAQLSSAMLLMGLMLVLSPQMRAEFPGGTLWLLLLIPVGWFVLRPHDIVSLAKWISPRVQSQPNLTARNASMWLGLYVLSWTLGGVILYFLLCALAPQSRTLLPVCVGLVAASGVLAILAGPLPGGLGIREISLVLLLGLYVPSPVAVAGGILLRLWLLLGEAIIALLVFLFARSRKLWAQTDRNTP
jgi:glycosyltransferase 2 family protein